MVCFKKIALLFSAGGACAALKILVATAAIAGGLCAYGAKPKVKAKPEPEPEPAENALGTQRVTVIDTIRVEADTFFRHYRLDPSAGTLLGPEAIPFAEDRSGATMVYRSESGDVLMYARPDTTGMTYLVETNRLLDGSYTAPQPTPEFLRDGAEADFPFLSADGLTLYYASDREGSVGGFDIWLATRDPQTGEYLLPANAGAPFNSEADDYLMAIDEENGVGWWASDREGLEDQLTIYVYVLPEFEEKLLGSAVGTGAGNAAGKDTDAKSHDGALAQASGADEGMLHRGATSARVEYGASPEGSIDAVEALRRKIRQIVPGGERDKREFAIPMPGGEYLCTMKEVRRKAGGKGEEMVRACLKAEKEYGKAEATLAELRRDYAGLATEALAERIRREETALGAKRTALQKARSAMYSVLLK